ncbi:MAG: aspartate/glutamate racemase family protein [Erysipelotrichaceae bacterium]|nr:aspartate/glutamate racemase family protein [Erysipelotrichaceae bacterium]
MIVVFDSGLGGLTALDSLVKRYPQKHFLFYGDRENAPYGNKSVKELRKIFDGHAQRFAQEGVKDVLLQCNTMCSVLDLEAYPFRMHDIISLTLQQCEALPRDSRILVCATAATIKRGRYQQGLQEMGFAQVEGCALKELAGMIERFASKEEVLSYLQEELPAGKFDYVILGCTHYPIHAELFQEVTGGETIDSTDLSYDFLDEDEEGGLELCLKKDDELEAFLQQQLHVPYRWAHE